MGGKSRSGGGKIISGHKKTRRFFFALIFLDVRRFNRASGLRPVGRKYSNPACTWLQCGS
jgi:hypothetical protein